MRAGVLLTAMLLAHTWSPALCARQLGADDTDDDAAASATVAVTVTVQVNVSAAAAASGAGADEAGGELQVSRYSAQQCAWLDQCMGIVRAHQCALRAFFCREQRWLCSCAALTREGPRATPLSAPERHAGAHRLRLVLRRAQQQRQRPRVRLGGAPNGGSGRAHHRRLHPLCAGADALLRV
jgi:hypothetical protein